jgi:hypothetical protein
MGNTTSTQQTNLAGYQDAIQFIPDELQSRIQSIDPLQLSAELDMFKSETPSVSLYWIAVMQKQGIIDWSNLTTTVINCIDDISSNKSSIPSVKVLVEYILVEVRSKRETALFGIHWIIKLANAVDQHFEWVISGESDPLPIHQAAANAIEVIDKQCTLENDYEPRDHLMTTGLGRELFEAYNVYKGVNMFILAGFDKPYYPEDNDFGYDFGRSYQRYYDYE